MLKYRAEVFRVVTGNGFLDMVIVARVFRAVSRMSVFR